MERPENCPEKLYKLMCRTWQHRPSSRPTFLQIVTMLLDDADQSFRDVSFYFTTEGQDLLQQPQRKLSGLNIDIFYVKPDPSKSQNNPDPSIPVDP